MLQDSTAFSRRGFDSSGRIHEEPVIRSEIPYPRIVFNQGQVKDFDPIMEIRKCEGCSFQDEDQGTVDDIPFTMKTQGQ